MLKLSDRTISNDSHTDYPISINILAKRKINCEHFSDLQTKFSLHSRQDLGIITHSIIFQITVFKSLLKLLIGSNNDRFIKKHTPIIEQINAMEATLSTASDQEIKKQFHALQDQAKHNTCLDTLIPECFALVREANEPLDATSRCTTTGRYCLAQRQCMRNGHW